jgi:hypothetical protein
MLYRIMRKPYGEYLHTEESPMHVHVAQDRVFSACKGAIAIFDDAAEKPNGAERPKE